MRGKIFQFNTEVAKEVGSDAASVLHFIYFWCDHNRRNGKNFYDGKYWSFNSASAFEQEFPYLSERQIRYAITKLEEAEYIVEGNFNSNKFDKTKWYAVTKKTLSIYDFDDFDVTNLSDGANESVSSYNNNNKYSNDTVNSTQLKELNKELSLDNSMPETHVPPDKDIVQMAIDHWNKLPYLTPVKRVVKNKSTYRMILARVREYGLQEVLNTIDNIVNMPWLLGITPKNNGWQAEFDWLFHPENFEHTYNGKYLDRNKRSLKCHYSRQQDTQEHHEEQSEDEWLEAMRRADQ